MSFSFIADWDFGSRTELCYGFSDAVILRAGWLSAYTRHPFFRATFYHWLGIASATLTFAEGGA